MFAYRVIQPRSKYSVSWASGPNSRPLTIIAGYSGLVYADADTGLITRMTLNATEIPADFPIQKIEQVLDYDFTKIGESEYLLPLKSVVKSRSGKVLFVHAEDDLASLSEDQRRLLVINNGLNPPFGLVLAALRPEGPAVRLHCLSEGGQRIIPTFRGWHASPAVGFDLVLVVRQPGEQESYEAMPMRFIYLNNEWRALVLDAERLQQSTGLSCWQ